MFKKPNELITQASEHLQDAQDRLFFLAESLDVSRRVTNGDRLVMTQGASQVISDCRAVLEKVQKALDELQGIYDWGGVSGEVNLHLFMSKCSLNHRFTSVG